MIPLRSTPARLVLGAGVFALTLAVAAGAAAESGAHLSSKQPYQEPDAATVAGYTHAPAGYTPLLTESVARHGSRGLSEYKYDALLTRLSETALAENGFLSPEIGQRFLADLRGITAANVQNGYGQLTGQGAAQHRGLGERAVARNAALFARAEKDGDRIIAETSGEARATESGTNFLAGVTKAGAGVLTRGITPEPRPDLLYFHKSQNPDGTTKPAGSPELARAQAYEAYVAAQTAPGGTISAALDYINALPRSVSAADDVLSGIFTPDFIAKIGTPGHVWYNTVDGTKKGAVSCAPGADPAQDKSACGSPKKVIATPVDAAMTLYNLYIIGADMTAENTGDHTFDFGSYLNGRDADLEWFASLLDAEDFYEKGPGLSGHDDTYRVAQPLLDDFFTTIDDRVAGDNVAATFRFAHAETIIPFAALLKLPGSTRQAPDNAHPQSLNDVFDYTNNPWRGESVTPMAANVQWDVSGRIGTDPSTGRAFTPLVRMLYNEREIGFTDACVPVAAGSTWYKSSELKHCLNGAERIEDPRIAAAPVDPTASPSPTASPDPTASPSPTASPAPTSASPTDAASTGPSSAKPSARPAAAGALVSTGLEAENLMPLALLASSALLLGALAVGWFVLRRRRLEESETEL
ncbi:histidine acid phosphatase [Mycetocola saprophilus]|uniref:histidine acid phosphatase n=1 Tax=Mycetocola saprophilus TaxID=76636 RepID=UPI000A57C0AB|nr:histidine acid phosphatase [Mycetocola saprophilus]